MTKLFKRVPVFKVAEVVATRGPEYRQIIPEISPRYFFSNPRFRSLGQISFPKLIDYMGIYLEGSRWTLIIIETMINAQIRYLFLPLTEGINPAYLPYPEYGKPAFGIETNSSFYGKRQWEVFDAFADTDFHSRLFDLFFPWGGLSKDHVNSYIDIQESGIGTFKFHTKYELGNPKYWLSSGEMELAESELLLRYAEYELKIYQTLPLLEDGEFLETDSKVSGWIVYSGEEGLQLLIGVLYNVEDKLSS